MEKFFASAKRMALGRFNSRTRRPAGGPSPAWTVAVAARRRKNASRIMGIGTIWPGTSREANIQSTNERIRSGGRLNIEHPTLNAQRSTFNCRHWAVARSAREQDKENEAEGQLSRLAFAEGDALDA